jgi:peptide methionine sulfoxide reductase MsrB
MQREIENENYKVRRKRGKERERGGDDWNRNSKGIRPTRNHKAPLRASSNIVNI